MITFGRAISRTARLRIPNALVRSALAAIALGASALALGLAVTPEARAADCVKTLFDGGGYRYDFQNFGALDDGGSNGPTGSPPGPVSTSDAWDGFGGLYVYAPGANFTAPTAADTYDPPETDCSYALNDREIVYPVLPLHGLEVQFRGFVDSAGPAHGARLLTVLRNPGADPIAVDVALGRPPGNGALGSDAVSTVRATSDGTNLFSPSSLWGVSTDSGSPTTNGDPALAHIWDGPGGAARVGKVTFEPIFVTTPSNLVGSLYWSWKGILVDPGETVALISYEIQEAVPGRDRATEVANAVAQARARETQSAAVLYAGMSPAEISGTLNWGVRPSAVSASIAPVKGANAAAPVRLDGSGSLGAAGLPQCGIASYAWQADGKAVGSGAQLPHFFSPGVHTVKLTVTGRCGDSATAKAGFSVAEAFELGRLKANARRGNAQLVVDVRGPCKLTLAGKGIRKVDSQVKQAGKVKLTIKPTGRVLDQLRSHGRAKTTVTVSLQPVGGPLAKESKAVTLKLDG